MMTFIPHDQLTPEQQAACAKKWKLPPEEFAGLEFNFHKDGVTPYVRRPIGASVGEKNGPKQMAVQVDPAADARAGLFNEQIVLVPLSMIDDSPTQPRTTADQAKHEELCGLMREHGWLPTHPMLLRPKAGPGAIIRAADPANEEGRWQVLHPERMEPLGADVSRVEAETFLRDHPNRFETASGHRRSRAARTIGLVTALAIVRGMSDVEMQERQLIENLSREDLNPVDEAEHLKRMLELKDENGRAKHNRKSLADRLGKSEHHIIDYLLLCNLEGEAREAVATGRLAVSIGYAVGGIPNAEVRENAAREIMNPSQGEGPMKARAATDYIRRECTRDLRKARFDVEDEMLRPPAVACVVCKFNSAYSEDGKKGGPKVGVCGNIACFNEKEDAAWERWRAANHAPDKGRMALSRERCAEIFDGEGELAFQSGLVDLGASPDAGLLRDADAFAERTAKDGGGEWKELTKGRLTEVFVARDPKMRRRDLADVEAAKAAAELNGHHIFKTSKNALASARGRSDETPHREATLEVKAEQDDGNAYHAKLTNRLQGTLNAKAVALGAPPARAGYWMLQLRRECGTFDKAASLVEDRLGCEYGKLCDVLELSGDAKIWAALTEVQFVDCYTSGSEEFAQEFLEHFGVSIDDAAAAVKAEMAAAKSKTEGKTAKGAKGAKAGKSDPTPEENEAGLMQAAREAYAAGATSLGALQDALLIGTAEAGRLLDAIIDGGKNGKEPMAKGKAGEQSPALPGGVWIVSGGDLECPQCGGLILGGAVTNKGGLKQLVCSPKCGFFGTIPVEAGGPAAPVANVPIGDDDRVLARLPEGCRWDDPNRPSPGFEWSPQGVCSNPDELIIEVPKKEKLTLKISVARGRREGDTEDAWYYGWELQGRQFGSGANPNLTGTGYFTQERALADAAALLVRLADKEPKISAKTRELIERIAVELDKQAEAEEARRSDTGLGIPETGKAVAQ